MTRQWIDPSVPFGCGEEFFPFIIRPAEDGQDQIAIWCQEHQRGEWVPVSAYDLDVGDWYHVDVHPRFSPLETLLKAGQRLPGEIRSIKGLGFDDRADADRKVFLEVLKASRTPKEFLENLHPILFTNLRTGERTSRVRNAFKKKFDEKAFTVDEFMSEENQELRRLMLRSGLPIGDVLSRMKLVARDEEGELYEIASPDSGERLFVRVVQPVRYLHVKCPSTGADYLLEVPAEFWDGKKTIRLDRPRDARRWTFDLPPGAKFVKEA